MAFVKIKGLKETIDGFTRAEQDFLKAGARGLMKSGLLLQRRSQKEVPVDTANLKSGAYTEMIAPTMVHVGYQAEYAMPVHEDMEANHPVGKAKYLEDPATRTAPDVLKILNDALGAFTKK